MSELAYLYAVTRRGTPLPPGLLGVADGDVQLLEHGEVAAVWSRVPAADFDEEPLRAHLEDVGWLERTARAHQEVVDAVAAGGCVLPLRMAVVYRGDDGLRRMLDEGRDRLARALQRLEGRIEWGVKVYMDERVADAADRRDRDRAARSRAPGDHSDRGAAGSTTGGAGRAYLRRRKSRRDDEEREWELAARACRLLHAQLARLAEADRLLRPQQGELARGSGRNVLNASYLVAREHEYEFVTCARESSLPGVRVEVSGPWAPYSFAGLEAGR